jgi:ABC-2 type transport system permease protein
MGALQPIFYREYKIRTTNLVWLFFDILVPLAYLLVFGLGFTRTMGADFTVGGRPVSYDAFFLGGVLAMASFGIAMNTSWGWFMDRDNGIFYEMLTYPVTRGQLLFGKVSFNVLLSLVQAALTVAAGAVLLGIAVRWDRLHLALAATAVGTAAWFFLFSIFALRIRRNDVYNTVMNIFYFVLLFASSMFYPLEPMPAWLRWVATANPISWQVDFLRYATIGLGYGSRLAVECALFGAFTAVSFAAAVRALKAQE